MKGKRILTLTRTLLLIVGGIFFYFLFSTAKDGYVIWYNEENQIDFAVTGQVGDFVGGLLGTVINAAAFYYLYLTLNEQRKSGERQSFETRLYELIRLHKDNISELRYTKNQELASSRKVFRIIAKEFMECIHEIKRFNKMYPNYEVFRPVYRDFIEEIAAENKCKAEISELAMIDIAFCFIYFGLSQESEPILHHKFYHRYNHDYVRNLKFFLQLKPKEDYELSFTRWENFKANDVKAMKVIFEKVLDNSNKEAGVVELRRNFSRNKYYGGHQHRLGHYFRHLFQSFKYISSQSFLTSDEKYSYGKTIRAQLSTYEQFLLFFNSLSSLGMKWEYTAEIDGLSALKNPEDYKFITRYHLIKNLPGSKYYDITYRKFYPNVLYEYRDDITYTNEFLARIKRS